MIWLMRRLSKEQAGLKLSISHPYMMIALLCALQIALGVIHIWFVVPAWAQVAHVVVGSALITYIFAVYLSARSIQPS
jgi:heme A synthase